MDMQEQSSTFARVNRINHLDLNGNLLAFVSGFYSQNDGMHSHILFVCSLECAATWAYLQWQLRLDWIGDYALSIGHIEEVSKVYN